MKDVPVRDTRNFALIGHAGDGKTSLGEALLRPTRIYVRAILGLLKKYRVKKVVKAMAHITGGGITENLDRVLPPSCDARIVRSAWRVPRIFDLIAREAALGDEEMCRTFNMGIGYTLVVDPRLAPDAAAALRESGERVFEVGEIVEGMGKVTYDG